MYPFRSTRPRPRSNVSAKSRRRWTPSVQRRRQRGRGDRRESRPRGTHCLATTMLNLSNHRCNDRRIVCRLQRADAKLEMGDADGFSRMQLLRGVEILSCMHCVCRRDENMRSLTSVSAMFVRVPCFINMYSLHDVLRFLPLTST